MKLWKYLSILILINLYSAGFSQNANDAIRIVQDEIGFGSRALAMGGAYTGLADDYSAVYWNPAGLALMKRSNFFGELSHLNFNNTAIFNQEITDETGNYTRLRSLGFAFPVPTTRGSLTLAFGYNRVKDFDQNLNFSGFNTQSNDLAFTIDDQTFLFDKDVAQQESITDEGGLQQWTVGAGVALSPNFDAGVSLTFWDGEDDYQFSFRQSDINDNYTDFPGDFDRYLLTRNLISDYTAFGLKVGGMFNLEGGLRVGGAIGFPVTFNVEETFTEDDVLTFDDGTDDPFDAPAGIFEYEVKTPFHFDGGASYSNQFITLAASVRFRDWSQTKFDVNKDQFFDSDFADLLDENLVISNDYRATTQYNLGAEVLIPGLETKLRAGYGFYPSPLKNAPSDLDKKILSGGVGFLIDRYVTLDVTYLRGTWKQESTDEFTPGGTLEDITMNKIFVGFSYRF